MGKPCRNFQRLLAKVLQICGGLGCLAVFLWWFGLLAYYSATRSPRPLPERNWNIQLPWTHVVYGTPHEASQIITAGDWIFPFFAMALIGAALENFRKRRSEKNSDS